MTPPGICYDQRLGPQLREGGDVVLEMLGFDTSRAPFDDPAIRRAVAMAVDWERLAAIDGEAETPTSLLPPGMPGRDGVDRLLPHDPDAARAELAAAGHAGGAGLGPVTLATYGVGPAEAIAHEIERELGIHVVVEAWPFDDHATLLDTDTPHLWTMAWSADYPHPHDILGLLLRTGSSANEGGWSDPRFDELIDAAAATTDPTEQRDLYAEAQDIVRDEAPLIPLGYGESLGPESRRPARCRRLGRGPRALRGPGMGRLSRRAVAPLLFLVLAWASAVTLTPTRAAEATAPADAAGILAASPVAVTDATLLDPVFESPSARGDLGEDVVFETTFRSAQPLRRVEFVRRLVGDETAHVSLAAVEPEGSGVWRARVIQTGHVAPNTAYRFRFRAVTEDGARSTARRASTASPTRGSPGAASRTTTSRSGGTRATRGSRDAPSTSPSRAIVAASDLLGAGDIEPVDFFVYADDRSFRQAIGPATRENVAGEAHADIGTLFGLIEPRQVGSDWVNELVAHELAHLVFAEVARGPYGYPPRWFNEGLAVHLSRGIDEGDPHPGRRCRAQRLDHPARRPCRPVPHAGQPFQAGLCRERLGCRPPGRTHGEQASRAGDRDGGRRDPRRGVRGRDRRRHRGLRGGLAASVARSGRSPSGRRPGARSQVPVTAASTGAALLR